MELSKQQLTNSKSRKKVVAKNSPSKTLNVFFRFASSHSLRLPAAVPQALQASEGGSFRQKLNQLLGVHIPQSLVAAAQAVVAMVCI